MQAAPLTEPKRVSLQLRLSKTEIDVIEKLIKRMGAGALRRDLVETALRDYLRVVEQSGSFVQRSRGGRERRRISQTPARRYMVDALVAKDLNRIARQHRWPKAELVRQAIISFGEREGAVA